MAGDFIPIPLGLSQLPIVKQAGIYFLFHRGIVVYVGQSEDVSQRVGQHAQEGKKVFDGASFLPCHAKHLADLERHYIELMAPKYNQCRLAKFVRMARGEDLDKARHSSRLTKRKRRDRWTERRAAKRQQLSPGDAVSATCGPTFGMTGIIESAKGKRAVVVYDGTMRVTIPTFRLIRASDNTVRAST
jgi:hypothetical protein